MELVFPTPKYKSSFVEALKEYQGEKETNKHLRNEHYKSLNINELEHNFEVYVDRVLSKAKGENLPLGYVPESTFWLIDNNEFIGRVSIRHQDTEQILREGGHIGYDIRPTKRGKGYGKKILELALPKAKELGFNKILVTCSANNIPSRKVIEANGGKFESSVSEGAGKSEKLRFWISLT